MRRRRFWRIVLIILAILVIVLVAVRLALPDLVRWYVNRTLNQSPLYDGRVGEVQLHLWRGAYSIHDVRIIKTTGNVPVPLFSGRRVDLSVEWPALWEGKLVGRIVFESPELNFVDGEHASEDQVGDQGPWLEIIQDLFPLKINSAAVHGGRIHFRAFGTDPPVDVYLSTVEGHLTNLTNIHEEVAPLITTVQAHALAMDHARLEFDMKLDPFSYKPTFQLAVRLLGLDVTQTNALVQAYGGFDFEDGWFDFVAELEAKEGMLEGYVMPLYRDLQVVDLQKDLSDGNPLLLFWEVLVGTTTELLENQPRNQFGTRIPLTGQLDAPDPDILSTVANILYNGFIRAYLPRLQGTGETPTGLTFEPGTPVRPDAVLPQDARGAETPLPSAPSGAEP